MRDDPGVSQAAIARCLEAHYGVRAEAITFLPLGFDPAAAVYEIVDAGGTSWFLKLRAGPVDEVALAVPGALIDAGVPNILAPVRTRSGDLWRPLDGHDGYAAVLFPFVRGESAMDAGMTDEQWREFGATLRAVHDSGLHPAVRDRLPVEDFALPSAALVREILALVADREFEGPAASRFQAFWRAEAGRIRAMLARAESLGRSLRGGPFAPVPCHTDIHTANILVDSDGCIWLVDWDGPKLAPRERDLMFVVGSTDPRPSGRSVEDLFFAGYGPAEIDPETLVYFWYERVIEDIGEFGKSVFLDPTISEASREEQAELAVRLFAPGGDIDWIEHVPRRRWP